MKNHIVPKRVKLKVFFVYFLVVNPKFYIQDKIFLNTYMNHTKTDILSIILRAIYKMSSFNLIGNPILFIVFIAVSLATVIFS